MSTFKYDFQTADNDIINDCKTTLDRTVSTWTQSVRHNILPALEIMQRTRIKSSATSGDLIFKFPHPSMIPNQPFHPSINRYSGAPTPAPNPAIITQYYIWANLKNDLNAHHQRMNALLCSNDGSGGCLKYPLDYGLPGIVQSKELYNINIICSYMLEFHSKLKETIGIIDRKSVV